MSKCETIVLTEPPQQGEAGALGVSPAVVSFSFITLSTASDMETKHS